MKVLRIGVLMKRETFIAHNAKKAGSGTAPLKDALQNALRCSTSNVGSVLLKVALSAKEGPCLHPMEKPVFTELLTVPWYL